MNNQNKLDFTQTKINKYTFKSLRIALKQRSADHFGHLKEDNDLKQMTQTQALAFIYYFLEHAFDIPKDTLLQNYDQALFESAQLPPPPNVEQCLSVTNANLLFQYGLAKVNQHIKYDFEMLLHPDKYPHDWKTLIAQLLDFMTFKDKLKNKHFQLCDLLQESENRISSCEKEQLQLQAKVDQVEQSKITATRRKNSLQNSVANLHQVKEEKQAVLDQKTQKLEQMQQKLQAMQSSLKDKKDQLKLQLQKEEELRSQICTEDPLDLENERECAAQALRSKLLLLDQKQAEFNQMERDLEVKKELLVDLQSQRQQLESALEIKSMKQRVKKQLVHAQQQLDQLTSQIEILQQDENHFKSIDASQIEKDLQFRTFHSEKLKMLQSQFTSLEQQTTQQKEEISKLDKEKTEGSEAVQDQLHQLQQDLQSYSSQLVVANQRYFKIKAALSEFNQNVQAQLFGSN